MNEQGGLRTGLHVALWSALGGMFGTLAIMGWAWPAWTVAPIVLGFGLGSYLTENLGRVWSGLKHAGSATFAWRPDVWWWKRFVIACGYLWFYLGSYVLFFFGGLGFVWFNHLSGGELIVLIEVIVSIVTVMVLLCACATMGFVSITCRETVWQQDYVFLRDLCRTSNVFTMFWHLAILLTKTLFLIPRAMRWLSRKTGQFLWHFFVYIHSARRTICLVDTVICASLGLLAGAAWGESSQAISVAGLTGGLSGFLLGFMNYELVSVRWLKLQPA